MRAPQADDDDGTLNQADELFRQGSYQDAASLYSQLAERESDRRQRSVIRAKERDARAALEEQKVRSVLARVDGFVGQKRLTEALALLIDQQRQVTTQHARDLFEEPLLSIKKRIASKKRGRVLICLVLLAIIGAAAYLTRQHWWQHVGRVIGE